MSMQLQPYVDIRTMYIALHYHLHMERKAIQNYLWGKSLSPKPEAYQTIIFQEGTLMPYIKEKVIFLLYFS